MVRVAVFLSVNAIFDGMVLPSPKTVWHKYACIETAVTFLIMQSFPFPVSTLIPILSQPFGRQGRISAVISLILIKHFLAHGNAFFCHFNHLSRRKCFSVSFFNFLSDYISFLCRLLGHSQWYAYNVHHDFNY